MRYAALGSLAGLLLGTTACLASSGSGAPSASSGAAGGATGSAAASGAAGGSAGATTGAGTSGGASSAGAASGTTGASVGSGSGTATGTGSGSSSGGRIFYVSPEGSDSAPGTQSAPWQTLQHAGVVVQAGDTVLAEAGSYDGPIFGWDTPPCSNDPLCVIAGTPQSPIVFEADPRAAPGSVVIGASNSQNDNGFDLEPGCDYVDIVGFTVDNLGSGDQGPGTITKAGIAVNASTGNRIVGNTVDGVAGIGGILVNAVTDTLIEGNTCVHVQGTGTTGHGMYVSGSSVGVQVVDNLIRDNDYVGIHVNGDVSEGLPGVVTGLLIAGNLIYGNGQNGINADGLQSSTIENNVIYGNDRNGIELYQIDACGGSTGNVIVNNTIDQSIGAGSFAISIGACAYDNQDSQPTPADCMSGSDDTSTGNLAFNNVLLGGAGITSQVASDDLTLSNNLGDLTATLFLDAGAGDYTLAPGGPGIGSGVASFDGVAAPDAGAQYDIGAFAFGLE